MSNVTKGEQMPLVLNACDVQAAVVGNHDLDFGRPAMAKLIGQCNFPWLMANVRDKDTGELFDGCARCASDAARSQPHRQRAPCTTSHGCSCLLYTSPSPRD